MSILSIPGRALCLAERVKRRILMAIYRPLFATHGRNFWFDPAGYYPTWGDYQPRRYRRGRSSGDEERAPLCHCGGIPARVIRFRWDVETILRHEMSLYPPEKRLTRTDLEHNIQSY